ncbi:MAG: BMP family ABC transporter substrate-binding protein [Clostridiales bacterium]|nr:BMP family ABC transporter substrate-binding protein [Clostridiales bacterium]
MKKIISLITAAALMIGGCFALASCGGSTNPTEGGSNTPASANSDFIVGAIYINSQNDTAGYTYAHHHGITTAMENLGLSVSDNLKIVDNVPEDDEQVRNAIDQLAGQGCNIIFGISFGYLNAMNEAAEDYPDIVFSHATGYLCNDTNFNNYFGRIYQARYLAGIAAGYKSLELGNDNLGYVSAWGTEYAETCSGINAFTLGARAVNPDAVVHVKQISTWGDQELERQAAEVLIDTYNCCVIAQHCDSAQPQIVAEERGVFGCGYNSDMAEQAPNAHLTAPVWNWDVYYQLAMETAMNGDASSFFGTVGNYYGGLAEGMVGVSPLTSNCTPDTAEAIDQARELMVSGQWDVFSGTRLSFSGSVDGDGGLMCAQIAEDLVTNDGTVIVEAGGPSVDDGVIQGSMNYYVEGVIAES